MFTSVLTAMLMTVTPPPTGYGSGSARPTTPKAQLTVGYTADAGHAAAVKLTCDPAGGGHPKAAQACALLTDAGVNPDRITPAGGACTMIYAPVTATIKGEWRRRAVDWTHRYGNTCEMQRATGVLFDF